MTTNPVSGKLQNNSINIQIPILTFFAEKRFLIPVSFSLVVFLFFFTFFDFRIVEAMEQPGYTANEQTRKSVTGFNLITGTALSISSINDEAFQDFPAYGSEPFQSIKKVDFNVWALIAFASSIVGVYVFLKKVRREALYGVLLAATGAMALLMLLWSTKKYEVRIDLGFLSVETRMVFQFAYWAALLCFITAGSISFFRLKMKSSIEPIAVPNPATPIHISIITQEADTTSNSNTIISN